MRVVLGGLFDELFDSAIQLVYGGAVLAANRVNNAVFEVVFQYHFAGIIDSAADGGELDQDFGAVAALLHHSLDAFQVADSAGEAVDDGAGLGMAVGMAVGVFMGNVMGVHIGVADGLIRRGGGGVVIFVHDLLLYFLLLQAAF